jgi:superfamily II DNA or RNA helicase
MPTVRNLVSRAPLHELKDLIPNSVEEVIEVTENETLSSRRKTEIALKVKPPELLLRNRSSRNKLFNFLKPDEAEELAGELGMADTDNPFTTLKNNRYYRNSEHEEILFEYFGVDVPDETDNEADPGLTSVYTNYGLFNYQRNVLGRVAEQLESDDNRVFLHMPTGSGKTRITMTLVCDVIKKTDPGLVLWLAEGQEMLDQAADEFENAWRHLGDRNVNVSRFYGSYDWDNIEEGLIVAGLQKLWNKEKTAAAFLANFSTNVSLIVFDEAHRAVAKTHQKMLTRLTDINPDCRSLGLSATPGRTYDDPAADRKLSELYHQNKESIDVPGFEDPFDFLVREGYLSDPDFNNLEMNTSTLTDQLVQDLEERNDGAEYPARILETLAEDDLRNIRITEKIQELIDEGHNRIILFATTVDHARIVSAVLKAKDIDSSVIISETPDYIRNKEISKYKSENDSPQVLCNYNVLTAGFDAPQTSAALIARPTTSLVLYSQMVGRAIRGPKVGGTEEAKIWTVIDTDLPGFGNLTEAFWNWEDVW